MATEQPAETEQLIPFGDVEQKLNSHYDAGALNTYGLDVGYFITPILHASVGYYYQYRDQEDVDGSGVRGRLAYDISHGLTTGINISYDEAYDTRVSADCSVRFGGPSTTVAKKKKWKTPVITLGAPPKNRDVRAHDGCHMVASMWGMECLTDSEYEKYCVQLGLC